MKIQKKYLAFLYFCACFYSATAQNKSTTNVEKWKADAIQNIQSGYPVYKNIALQIWNYAEVGYKEVKSSALLQKTLSDNGFNVKVGVAIIGRKKTGT